MRIFLIIMMSVFLSVVVAIGAALYWRLPLANWAARTFLDQQGFEDVQLAVSQIGTRQIRARDLRAGTDVAVDGVELDYAFPSLFAPRLVAIRVSGAEIDASNPNQGTIGRVRALLSKQPVDRAVPRNDRPTEAVEVPIVIVENLIVRYTTADVDATLALDGRTTADGAQGLGGDAQFSLELNGQSANGRARFKRHGDGRMEGTLDLSESTVRVGDRVVGGLGGTMRLTWDKGRTPTAAWAFTLADALIPEFESAGPATIKAEGALADERLSASFVASAKTLHARLLLTAGLALGDGNPAALALTTPRAEAKIEIAFPSALARSLIPAYLPAATGGNATLTADAALSAFPINDFPKTLQALGAMLLRQAVAARATLDASAIAFGDIAIADGALALALEAAADAGAIDLRLLAPAALSATADNGAPWQRLGVPAALADQLVGPCRIAAGRPEGPTPLGRLNLAAPVPRLEIDTALPLSGRCGPAVADARLQAQGQIAPTIAIDTATLSIADLTVAGLTVAGQPIERASWRGGLRWQDGRLAATGRTNLALPSRQVADFTIGTAVVDLPHTLSVEDDRLIFRLDGGGKATIDGGAAEAVGRLAQPVTVGIHALKAPLLDLSLNPEWPTRLAFRLLSEPIDFAPVPALGLGKIVHIMPLTADIRASATGDTLSKAEIVLQEAGLDLPGLGFSIGGLRSTANVSGDGTVKADFTIDAIRSGAPGPILAPVAAKGTVAFADQRLSANGQLDALLDIATDQAPLANWTLSHHLTSKSGAARLVWPPFGFTPGGLQPKSLYGGLTQLTDVSGAVGATIDATWRGTASTSTGTIQLSELSFGTAGQRIAGIDADVRFANLWPLRSEPGQALTVRRITGVSDLSDIAFVFSVLPGAPANGPIIAITDGSARFAEGRLSFANSRLELGRGLSLLPVRVDGLSIAALAALTGVDGISGTGSMSGRLPVTIDGARIAVDAGQLTADHPGRLQVKSPSVRQALAGTADQVDLLLEALEDFHYDQLNVTVNKDLNGTAQITLGTEGNNPAVLDGYPFRFNINLESNLDNLLATLGTASRLSEEAVRATVKDRR